MPTSRLPNYIRTHRKRAYLTQVEVAYLVGAKSGARISRHEHFKESPNLQTLLAYELLFGTPARDLFGGIHREVEQKLRDRIRCLIRKISRVGKNRVAKQKIEMLKEFLDKSEWHAAATTA